MRRKKSRKILWALLVLVGFPVGVNLVGSTSSNPTPDYGFAQVNPARAGLVTVSREIGACALIRTNPAEMTLKESLKAAEASLAQDRKEYDESFPAIKQDKQTVQALRAQLKVVQAQGSEFDSTWPDCFRLVRTQPQGDQRIHTGDGTYRQYVEPVTFRART